MQNNQSEVARTKANIELEWAAACHAMYGTSQGASQHGTISSKMHRVGTLHDDLKGMIGEGRAAKFLVKTMDRV